LFTNRMFSTAASDYKNYASRHIMRSMPAPHKQIA
jgi:hypothetical protein